MDGVISRLSDGLLCMMDADVMSLSYTLFKMYDYYSCGIREKCHRTLLRLNESIVLDMCLLILRPTPIHLCRS